MPTQCYWLAATDEAHVQLRRFTRHDVAACLEADGPWGHDATSGVVAIVQWALTDSNGRHEMGPGAYVGNPAWPSKCGRCGYLFADDDEWQVMTHRLYIRHDTGERTTLDGAGPGAMFDATWYPASYAGPDGIHLAVKCPPRGHVWLVDGRASNCDRVGVPHQCWVRTGDPRQPETLTVGKGTDPSKTCHAGGGSIAVGKPGSAEYYHGFLQAGYLTDHLG